MNKITCGKCAMKQGMTLEERLEMPKQLKEGLNICDCGRKLRLTNGRLMEDK